MDKLKFILTIGILLFLVGCIDKSLVYSEAKVLPKQWKKDGSIVFSYTIKDTSKLYNLYFVLRNYNYYPYRNINLFVDINGRFGPIRKDTIEYELASASGEWYGKGLGNLKENLLVYKEDVKFPHPGGYSIKVRHAMRKKNLEGIEDLSLKISTNYAK